MSEKFRPNWSTVERLFGDALSSLISQWQNENSKDILRRNDLYIATTCLDTGYSCRIREPSRAENDENWYLIDNNPINGSMLGIYVYKYEVDMMSSINKMCSESSLTDYAILTEKSEYCVYCPFIWLSKGFPSYTIYNVQFQFPEELTDSSFDVFKSGYIGVTSRHPMQRFNEHRRDMLNGGGHFFHSAWRSLAGIEERWGVDIPNSGKVMPSFCLIGRADTLDEIYELENRYVAKHTLAPKGLNAIPGGREGLKYIHLWKENQPLADIDARDAALIDLEKGRSAAAAHYRKGHIRHLPEGFQKRTTWVSPCWVNLPKLDVAA
ncbi:hypothetical protein [Manganibacter manganicus]|uniref:hypothetical protein n=1 Tax=Manganibacter manganicus TaxID=1873176 RepID=UPI00111A9439|nr:hypothetical protein [Pseudaminobacter manganicus]